MILVVHFKNNSQSQFEFENTVDAYDQANRLSLSSGYIRRVELLEFSNDPHPRALWDATWNELSKRRGLQCPA